MYDAILLEKTKSRLRGLKKLKNLTIKTILINLDALTQKQSGNYIQKKLSPELREVVLQELLINRCPVETNTTDVYFNKKRSLCVLMNTRTKKLDLDHLMSFYPADSNSRDELYEVLMVITIAAPNVRHLKINMINLDDCFSSDFNRDSCIRFLSFLKELRILEIVGKLYAHEVDFALLCGELPNLRVLSAKAFTFDGSKMSEEEIRNSFGRLTMLEFGLLSWETKCQIWKVLPNLDIVIDGGRKGFHLEDFVEDENIQARGKIYLDFDDYSTNSNVSAADVDFSSIRHLKVTCDEEKWNMFEKILKWPTALESLNLFLMNTKIKVEEILLQFGASLRWLFVGGSADVALQSVQLNRLSEACPNLEVLHLSEVNVSGNSSQPSKFFHLEELVFEETELTGECLTTVFSSAPNLQKVMIDTLTYNLEDLQHVKNLIVNSKILGSLRSLHWGIRATSSESVYKKIADIVKRAAALLPEFRDLKFSYHHTLFNAESYEETSSSNYFTMFRRNPRLYKAIMDDTNLFDVLKSFE